MDMNPAYSINKTKEKLEAAEEEFKQINKLLNREREHRSALRELLNDTEQRIETLNIDVQKAKAKIEKLRYKAEQEELVRKLQAQKRLEVSEAMDEQQDTTSEVVPSPHPKISFFNDYFAGKENGNQGGVSGAAISSRANRSLSQPHHEVIKVPIGDNSDLESCEKLWTEAVQALRNEKRISMFSCARGGRAVGVVDDSLIVVFKSAFQSNRMNRQDFRQVMEDLLCKVSDKGIKLQCYSEAEYIKLLDSQKTERKPVNIEEYCLF